MSEKVSITKSKLDSLANAIASVGETSVPKTIAQMESAVLELTIPPTISSLTVTPSNSQQVFDGPVDGYRPVTVEAASLQAKTGINPTMSSQTIIADSTTVIANTGDFSQSGTPTYNNPSTTGYYSFSMDLSAIETGKTYHVTGSGQYMAHNDQAPTNYTIDDDWVAGNDDIPLSISTLSVHLTWTSSGLKFTMPTAHAQGDRNIKFSGNISFAASSGYLGLSSVQINAMPSGTAGTPTATKGTVSNHSISVTPSVTNTTGYITGGTLTGTAVTVSASELVSGTKTISASGTTDVTNYASASVAAGTAGTPTATKGTVSNHSISITPSVTNTTGYITGGTKTGTAVTVNVAELESGTKTITESGTGISVSGYSTVDVAVQAGTIIDDGDGNINLSPTGEVAVITPLTVNQNGTYTAPSNTGYSPVTVNVEGSSAASKNVKFIDYDGTVLYSYTATEAQALTELPANPSHARLTAQGWNWTLTQIKDQLMNVGGEVWVGQMYTTESGATEIDIELDNSDYLSPYLTIAVNGTVSVDWGDGTTASTVTGTSDTTLTYTLHEYATIGNYTIKISVVSGYFAFFNASSVQASILSVYSVDSNGNYNKAYTDTVKRIFIGDSTRIGSHAFIYCHSLQSITIPSSVTSISGTVFQYCYSLRSITVPSGVTSISSYLFQTCYSLQNITIPSGVTSIGSNAFDSCHSLQGVTIPSSVTSIGSLAFNGCYSIQNVTIPNGVTNIQTGTFQYCYTLNSVTIPSSVTSISGSAFQYCYSLNNITIPSSVTSIQSSAFYNCYSLQSITIPDGVTSIEFQVFYNCYLLQNVTIPDGVTSIGSSAFYNCYSLQSITIPSSVTSIQSSAFNNCQSLQSITIPSSVTSIGSNVFNGCYSLQSITIPSSVTSISVGMFQNCRSLRSIIIPSGVTSIGSQAFQYCYSLQSITIPDGVTSIQSSLFQYCYTLNSITIPDGVTSIGSSAFNTCYGVEEYHITPTTPPTLSNANAFTGIMSGTIIYVPSASLDAYKTASNWSTYASYMQGE